MFLFVSNKSAFIWFLIVVWQWKANGHRMMLSRPMRIARLSRCNFPFRTCSMALHESKVDESYENPTLTSISSSSDGKTTILSTSFLILNAVAVIWGTQHVVIKSSLDAFPSPSVLNFWRFATSAVLFLPAFVHTLSNKNTRTLRHGAELGLWTTLGFAFQSIGLLSTTASRSAFLLYLNVKIVPFLACLLLGRTISARTWVSALMALSGTWLLSSDGGGLNVGDLWCVAAAVASACFILRIEKFSRENDAAELNGVSFITVTILCALWIGIDLASPAAIMARDGMDAVFSGQFVSLLSLPSLAAYIVDPFLSNPWPILYLGAFSTGVCNYLQTVGQRDIAAEKAAIIYSMDPVYGAFFSYLFLHEELGVRGLGGAAMIMLGLWVSASAPSEAKEELPVVSVSTTTDTTSITDVVDTEGNGDVDASISTIDQQRPLI